MALKEKTSSDVADPAENRGGSELSDRERNLRLALTFSIIFNLLQGVIILVNRVFDGLNQAAPCAEQFKNKADLDRK